MIQMPGDRGALQSSFSARQQEGVCCRCEAVHGCAHLPVGQEILSCASFESGSVAFPQIVYLHLLCHNTSAQCWLFPAKRFYTPPFRPIPTLLSVLHFNSWGSSQLHHRRPCVDHTCVVKVSLHLVLYPHVARAQLELRRVIMYTSWILPRDRGVCKFPRASQWGFLFVDAAKVFLPLPAVFEVSPSPLMPPYSVLGA